MLSEDPLCKKRVYTILLLLFAGQGKINKPNRGVDKYGKQTSWGRDRFLWTTGGDSKLPVHALNYSTWSEYNSGSDHASNVKLDKHNAWARFWITCMSKIIPWIVYYRYMKPNYQWINHSHNKFWKWRVFWVSLLSEKVSSIFLKFKKRRKHQ